MDLPDDINIASIYASADSNPRSMLLTKPNIEQYARNFAVSPRLVERGDVLLGEVGDRKSGE
jgi:hypothetical protein